MRLAILSLPLVCDDEFNAEFQLQRFRHDNGNTFEYEQLDEEEGESKNRNDVSALLDVFRVKNSNHILCVFPRPFTSRKSSNTCDLSEKQLVSLMTKLADLHRNHLCIWPRRLCDSILIDPSSDDEDNPYLVGAGLYQIARIAPFQPEKDVEELREWLIRSNRLDEKMHKILNSLLDLQLHFALQNGPVSNKAGNNFGGESSSDQILFKSNHSLDDQEKDKSRRFIWSYRKEYSRICLTYDLNEILEEILQETLHPLPSAFELYRNQHVMVGSEFERLMRQSKEFVFDLSKNVIFNALDDNNNEDDDGVDDNEKNDHEFNGDLVGIITKNQQPRGNDEDSSRTELMLMGSKKVADPLRSEESVNVVNPQPSKVVQSKTTNPKKELVDNALPTEEITQKLTDFLFRSFGGGDPVPRNEGKNNPQKPQQQSTEATSSTLSSIFGSQISKEKTNRFDETNKKIEPRVVKRESDGSQPTKVAKESVKVTLKNGSESEDFNLDEDIRRLEDYFFSHSSSSSSTRRRFHLLDKQHFETEKLPRLEAHLAKFGSLPACLRREIWTEISLVKLGGWSRQVFWHILEMTNVDLENEKHPHKQQLLDQLKKDLPRCHSYMTNVGLQQSIERILVAWECFDWEQFELNELLSSCVCENDADDVHKNDVSNSLKCGDDGDGTISNLKQRLAEETMTQSMIEENKIVSTLEDFFAETNVMGNDLNQRKPIMDEFDVRDLVPAPNEPQLNVVEPGSELDHMEPTLDPNKEALPLIDITSNKTAAGDDVRWEELFNSSKEKMVGSSTKKRHLDDVLEEMPSHSLFQAHANALGLDYLDLTPHKRKMDDGPQLLNPFTVDELLKDADEDVFAVNNDERGVFNNNKIVSTKVEEAKQEDDLDTVEDEQLLVDVSTHVDLPTKSDKSHKNEHNPFWDPNDSMDEYAAISTAATVDDEVKNVTSSFKINGESMNLLPESPIVAIQRQHQQDVEPKAETRKPMITRGRSYWQGMDSICAAILVACEMDEVASLSVLNYLTEVVFKGKVFVQDTKGIEDLGAGVKSRLAFFHPRLLNHLSRLCAKEGESLTVMLLPWLLTCFCHVLPLSLEHDNVLLMLLDWIIVGRVSVPELVSAVLVQLSNELLVCKELTDAKHWFSRLPSNVHADISRLFRQSLKACDAMQTFTAGRCTIDFSQIASCKMDLSLLEKSSLASQCLLVDLTSNTIVSSQVERLSIRMELLKGMDLERDGAIIAESITRARDAKSKRIVMIRSDKEEEENEALGFQLARVLVEHEVPYVCTLG